MPPAKLAKETWSFAQNLLSKGPLALQMGQQFYYRMVDMPFSQRLLYRGEVFTCLCTSQDAQEGVQAFQPKKVPVGPGK